jgi:hypothetical protein
MTVVILFGPFHTSSNMVLDLATVILIVIAQSAGAGLALLLAAQTAGRQSSQALTVWGGACLTTAVGWCLVVCQGLTVGVLPLVAGAALLVWSVGEFGQAFRIHDGEEPRRAPVAIQVFLCAVATAFLTRSNSDTGFRTSLCWVIAAGLMLGIACRLRFGGQGRPSLVRRVAAAWYLVLAVLYLIFGGLGLGAALHGGAAWHRTEPFQTALLALTSVGQCVIAVCLLVMCNERANSELKHLAVTDPLTGLLNRCATEELSRREIARAARERSPLAVVMLDADGFKCINDTMGHRAGDEALVAIASALQANIRAHDIVGRIGGDEFAVVLPNTPQDAA